MVKLSQIYEYLHTHDKALHNIAVELAKIYYPKWDLKVIYGSGQGYVVSPEYYLNKEELRPGTDGHAFTWETLHRHTYKNMDGQYVLIKDPRE